MTGVTLDGAIKRYGDVQVIHGIDLEIQDGEFCVFVGPSGCGKSTLLRMIAGLEETSEGAIRIGARDVTHADPSDRGVAMVFQTYALYPHMTVAENMGFGLRMNGVPKAEIARKVKAASDAFKPRRRIAGRNACRNRPATQGNRRDDDLCDPRSGRGNDPGGQDCRVARRPDRTGGCPVGALPGS